MSRRPARLRFSGAGAAKREQADAAQLVPGVVRGGLVVAVGEGRDGTDEQQAVQVPAGARTRGHSASNVR